MNNRFFDLALSKASTLLGKRGRIILLLAKMSLKLRQVQWKDVKAVNVKEKFFTLGRISKAYVTGTYREIPWKAMLLVVGAIIYFVSPIDLIPDLLPIMGLTDDVAILIAVYNSVSNEVDKFLSWEKSQELTS